MPINTYSVKNKIVHLMRRLQESRDLAESLRQKESK